MFRELYGTSCIVGKPVLMMQHWTVDIFLVSLPDADVSYTGSVTIMRILVC